MIDLNERKVIFFRAHIDPGVHAMPKNAVHEMDVDNMEIIEGTGIYIKNKQGLEFVVPFSNCQTIKLKPVEHEKKRDTK